MADPFTLATSVASIISLTIQLVTVTNEFARYTKEAFSGPRQLLEELKALSAVLEQLHDFLKTQAPGLNFSKTSALYVASDGCEARLKRILQKLQKYSKAATYGKALGNISHTLHRMKWPLEVKETREATEDIHRYAQVFMLALTVEGCNLLSKTFSALDELQSKQQDGTNEVLDAVQALPDYKEDLDRLSRNINKLEILSKDQALRDEQRGSLEKRKELLDKISVFSPHRRHYDSLSDHQEGTCRWFVDDSRFKSWERGDSEHVLWASGVPGAGKTILTSFVIEHLKGPLKHPHVAYIYCDYKDEEHHSALELIASITRQFAEIDEDIYEILKSNWAHSADQKYWDWHTINISWIVSVLQRIGQYKQDLFIIIDGLDEIPEYTERGEEVRTQFTNSLKELLDAYRILVTSRSHLNLETLLGRCGKLEISPPKSDIKAFVHSNFSTSTRLNRLLGENQDLKEELSDSLADRSCGMFLMARLQLNQISSVVTVRQMYSVLENTPTRLYDFYEEQIKRLRRLPCYERELCLRVLSWVFKCKRSLSAKELVAGLAVEIGDTHFDKTGVIDINLVLEVCAGLIHMAGPGEAKSAPFFRLENDIIGEKQVRFVHSTVQEYIADHKHELFDMDSDRDIFRSCWTYLSLAEIHNFTGPTDSLCKQYPFLLYAVNNWPAHVSAAMTDEDHLAMEQIMRPWLDQAQSLTLSASETSESSESENFSRLWSLWTNPYINNSSWKLSWWAASPRENWFSSCPSIVSLAVLLSEENDYAFRWLAHNALDPHALQIAVADNMPDLEALLKKLAAAGVRLDKYDHTKDFVYPPILEAINMSNRPVVEQLLDAGHDPNMRWKPGAYHSTQFHMLTPLEAAVQRGWKPGVRVLLEAGADPNLAGGKYGTAMEIAQRKGEVEILKMLVEVVQSLWAMVGSAGSVPVNANGRALSRKPWKERMRKNMMKTDSLHKLFFKSSTALYHPCRRYIYSSTSST